MGQRSWSSEIKEGQRLRIIIKFKAKLQKEAKEIIRSCAN